MAVRSLVLLALTLLWVSRRSFELSSGTSSLLESSSVNGVSLVMRMQLKGAVVSTRVGSKWRSAKVNQGIWWLVFWVLLSGDVHVNPGPVCFPCGRCEKPVASNHRGLCCDCCDKWWHMKCAGVSAYEYRRLASCSDDWLCPVCCLPPFNDSLFETTQSSLFESTQSSSSSVSPTPKGLNCVCANARSLVNKLSEFQAWTSTGCTHDFDIMAITETWLDDSVLDSELLPCLSLSLLSIE